MNLSNRQKLVMGASVGALVGYGAYRWLAKADAEKIQKAYGIPLSLARKVVEVSREVGIPDPAMLANVINFESRWDPRAYNSATGATGLIQFIPGTASELRTTTSALRSMSAESQMNYVREYFKLPRIRNKGRLRTQLDVYMAVYWPDAIGKGPTYPFPPSTWAANHGIMVAGQYAAMANRNAKMSTLVTLPGIRPMLYRTKQAVVYPAVIGAIAIPTYLGLRYLQQQGKIQLPVRLNPDTGVKFAYQKDGVDVSWSWSMADAVAGLATASGLALTTIGIVGSGATAGFGLPMGLPLTGFGLALAGGGLYYFGVKRPTTSEGLFGDTGQKALEAAYSPQSVLPARVPFELPNGSR